VQLLHPHFSKLVFSFFCLSSTVDFQACLPIFFLFNYWFSLFCFLLLVPTYCCYFDFFCYSVCCITVVSNEGAFKDSLGTTYFVALNSKTETINQEQKIESNFLSSLQLCCFIIHSNEFCHSSIFLIRSL
jgi:hypothetical protein